MNSSDGYLKFLQDHADYIYDLGYASVEAAMYDFVLYSNYVKELV